MTSATCLQDSATESHVIYSVGREEYDSCAVLGPHPRIVAYCTQPYQRKYRHHRVNIFSSKSKYFPLSRIFTLSFRSFSPVPNTLEFHPGQDYFFISGSDYCTSHNMKVMFKVLDSDTVRENVEKIGADKG